MESVDDSMGKFTGHVDVDDIDISHLYTKEAYGTGENFNKSGMSGQYRPSPMVHREFPKAPSPDMPKVKNKKNVRDRK